MRRRLTTSNVIPRIASSIPLCGKHVLEVGCGKGFRSLEIAEWCESLVAMDSDREAINWADRGKGGEAVVFRVGSILAPDFPPASFDAIIFTLSLHHLDKSCMQLALDNAVRLLRDTGHIIILEPGFEGSLHEAELLFGAGDGDERLQKLWAYEAMLSHPRLRPILEFHEEERFKYTNLRLFEAHLNPKRNASMWERFLANNDFELTARRRVNIFRLKG
ncbi:MAG: class I SAM-dependent methyltransferase [bacterium]|nr:class I SAM-dependent methyltransferase [bacterium]